MVYLQRFLKILYRSQKQCFFFLPFFGHERWGMNGKESVGSTCTYTLCSRFSDDIKLSIP